MLVNSTYRVISPPPPSLFPIIDTLEGLLESRFLGDSSYELFCGTEDFIIILMTLNNVLDNYFEDVLYLVN